MAESSVDEGASRTINAGSEVGQGIDPLTGVDNGGERESCPGGSGNGMDDNEIIGTATLSADPSDDEPNISEGSEDESGEHPAQCPQVSSDEAQLAQSLPGGISPPTDLSSECSLSPEASASVEGPNVSEQTNVEAEEVQEPRSSDVQGSDASGIVRKGLKRKASKELDRRDA